MIKYVFFRNLAPPSSLCYVNEKREINILPIISKCTIFMIKNNNRLLISIKKLLMDIMKISIFQEVYFMRMNESNRIISYNAVQLFNVDFRHLVENENVTIVGEAISEQGIVSNKVQALKKQLEKS